MKFVLTPEQMRKADFTAINDYNIPSIVLMENAARSAAEFIDIIIEDSISYKPRVLIICGSGNNGGDGFAVARHLCDKYHIMVYWIGSEEKMSPETKSNFLSIKKIGIDIFHIKSEDEINNLRFCFDCIIDSMIGVGGSENIKGLALSILKKLEMINTLKIAIDAPTGLNTETGAASPFCFKANYTITMFAIKTGMILNQGMDYCGEILTADLGAPEFIVENLSENMVPEERDVVNLLPRRKRISSKFDYGKVMVVAGSLQYPGAAALTANAAITSGSGLVYLYSSCFHPALLPEVIQVKLESNSDGSISKNSFDLLLEDVNKFDSIILGPGIGSNKEIINSIKIFLDNTPKEIPILIDADGLRALDCNKSYRKNIILTPHTGEFARLIGLDRKSVEINSSNLAKEWADKLNCIILLKHIPVIITDGNYSYWNTYGNPGMATGGCGDVLSGIIGGLLGQGLEPIKAAYTGALIHSLAGDTFAKNHTESNLTASELIKLLKEVFPY